MTFCICCITETWLNNKYEVISREFEELCYCIFHQSKCSRGGGTAILYKPQLSLVNQSTAKYSTFKLTETLLKPKNGKRSIRISSIYQTCRKDNNTKENINLFFEEFESYPTLISEKPCAPLVCGDLKLHLVEKLSPLTCRFDTLIDVMGFKQHVALPTHVAGGILDVVISINDSPDEKKSLPIQDAQICEGTCTKSDSFLVRFKVCCDGLAKKLLHKLIFKRNFSKINLDDIINSELTEKELFTDIHQALSIYNIELKRILDIHAPICKKRVKNKPSIWWNQKGRKARQQRRKAER